MRCNGHLTRLSDLDRFAELGIQAIRYPVLWEMLAPEPNQPIDWTWPDERLSRLRELNVQPIVGLVHHGSGPRHTSLVDPQFPEGLAQFAGQVAERYPWVQAYTPVNEPLTTARFSGLYGHWYPHGRDNLTFMRALLTQCKAVVLAMRAIRKVNSEAQLVQTDDMGRIYSTPHMAYQAEFENNRRWLTFDLLCGRVTPEHPIWCYLQWVGISEEDVLWFAENPCHPDVIGINHYLTSNRYLDENCDAYPEWTRGSNGRDIYVDVEAVRVPLKNNAGVREILKEAWDRYELPLAITEAHLGCTREEQLRWLREVWNDARSARRAGVDVRAVTAWSLLGAFDWDSVLTCDVGHYEPGVFDIRSPEPRPTAIAHLIRDLAQNGDSNHPVLHQPGWWRRADRLIYPPVPQSSHALTPGSTQTIAGANTRRDKTARPLVIVGAGSALANAFARACDIRALPYYLMSCSEMDLTDPMALDVTLQETQPWAVINVIDYSNIDGAEGDVDSCYALSAVGAVHLAEACARHQAQLLTFSSHTVFDGTNGQPYVESDAPSPINIYGQSKACIERGVQELLASAFIVRTGLLFGAYDGSDFLSRALQTLQRGESIQVAEDVCISATYVPDLVQNSLDLLIDGENGIWHLANEGGITPADLVRKAAQLNGLDSKLVQGCPQSELAPLVSQYNVLASERGHVMPPISCALERYVCEQHTLSR
jgi:dTDP-4-dehydrorhamnose reductase